MKALIEDSTRFHQAALSVQAKRQQLLASNIANADTPGFKARDLDFRAALRDALGGQGGPLKMTTTAAGHIPTPAAMSLDRYIGYRAETQSSVDGNTVNMDVERAAFAQNSLHYEAGVNFISSQLRGLRTAISGQ